MIDLYGIVSIPFLKKSAFTGSFRKMRYRLEKVVVEGEERYFLVERCLLGKSFERRETFC
mgnify:CR=1 FL=1